MMLLTRLAVAGAIALALPAGAGAQAGRRGDVLDANTASDKQLLSVPGITPAIAAGILERRPFQTMIDLDRVLSPSLGQAQRAAAYRRLFVQINLNTASDEELLLIPDLDRRGLDEITTHRPYKTLTLFRRATSAALGAKEIDRLEPYVFVPIDLNTASDADILSIPRMGQRMLREFKEYRPYKALAQFRREIGKYVDDKEVARLERYVTVN